MARLSVATSVLENTTLRETRHGRHPVGKSAWGLASGGCTHTYLVGEECFCDCLAAANRSTFFYFGHHLMLALDKAILLHFVPCRVRDGMAFAVVLAVLADVLCCARLGLGLVWLAPVKGRCSENAVHIGMQLTFRRRRRPSRAAICTPCANCLRNIEF